MTVSSPAPSSPAPNPGPPFEWVDALPALQQLAGFLQTVPRLALDTEADSLHHYYEKVCLIQISAAGRHFVVDPLAGGDLSPLLNVVAQKPLILHGADYDLRMLRASFGFEPGAAVFDTMLAAQLLGYEQFGLAALLQRFFQEEIPKSGQKWDWSRRPLQPEQIAYAVNDTRHLEALAVVLEQELRARDRLAWHQESCENMVRGTAQARERDPDAGWRIKGSNTLAPRGMALLKALWEWREEQAQRADRPPFKILNNQALIAFVEWLEAHPGEDPASYPALPRNIVGSRLAAVRRRIAGVDETPPSEWPGPRERRRGPSSRRNSREESLCAALLRARDRQAAELELPPPVLAPKEVVCAVARTHPQSLDVLMQTERLLEWQARTLAPVWLPALTTGAEDREPRKERK